MHDLKYKIIFLWRKNYLQRASSKAIAQETGVWDKGGASRSNKYNSQFKIDITKLDLFLASNKLKVNKMKNYLQQSNIPHYSLLYEDLYNPLLNGEERSDYFYQLIEYIQPNMIDEIIKSQHTSIVKYLSPNKKVNVTNTYKRIENINEIIQKLSNKENGFININ